jgi:hypothetical protein
MKSNNIVSFISVFCTLFICLSLVIYTNYNFEQNAQQISFNIDTDDKIFTALWSSFQLLFIPFLIGYRLIFGKIHINELGISLTILINAFNIQIIYYIIECFNLFINLINDFLFMIIKEDLYIIKPYSYSIIFLLFLYLLSYRLFKFTFKGNLRILAKERIVKIIMLTGDN